MVDLAAGGLEDKIVDAFPLSQLGIDGLALWHRLVGAGGIDFEGGLAVHPVIGAAESGPLRADDADMAGGERLAQQCRNSRYRWSRRSCLRCGHPGRHRPPWPFPACSLDIFFIGINLHLELVEDTAEVLVQFGMQDLADVLQPEALFHGLFADAHPGDIALADVHDALGVVDQVVNLALQDRFVVLLHLASGHLHDDGQGQLGSGRNIGNLRPDDLDLAVLDLVHALGGDPFHHVSAAAAAFQINIVAANPFALEGRTVRHRHRHLGHVDLQAAHLDGPGDDLIMGYIGNHMFIGADAGGQDLRDRRIGDGREAPVDGAGGVGIPFVGHITHRHGEGEDTVFVINQHLAVVARLDAAEGQGDAGGKTHGEDRGGNIRSEGDQAGRPADLDAGLDQLLGETLAVIFGGHEDVEVLLLELGGDFGGDLLGRSRATDGGKTGGGAVDELDAAFPQDDVIGRAQPDVVIGGVFRLRVEIRAAPDSGSPR